MGLPSSQASNALMYLTYGAFLVGGLYIAWLFRRQTKEQYLSSNRTQKGQKNNMLACLTTLRPAIVYVGDFSILGGVKVLIMDNLLTFSQQFLLP
jgi:hypothetical protein